MSILIIGEIDLDNKQLFFDKLKDMKGDSDTIMFTNGFFEDKKSMEKIYNMFKHVFLVNPELFIPNRVGNVYIVDKPRRFKIHDKSVLIMPNDEDPLQYFPDYSKKDDIVIKKSKESYIFNILIRSKSIQSIVETFKFEPVDVAFNDTKEYNCKHLFKEIGPNGEKIKNPGFNTVTYYKAVVH